MRVNMTDPGKQRTRRQVIRFAAALLFISCVAACATNALNVRISHDIQFKNLEGFSHVVKMGDMIALTDNGKKKLVITENFALDLSLNHQAQLDAAAFFDQVYNENFDLNDPASNKAQQFRNSLLFDGFISKERFSSGHYTVYCWNQLNNRFIAIISDKQSQYFLNVIGENVDTKILNNL